MIVCSFCNVEITDGAYYTSQEGIEQDKTTGRLFDVYVTFCEACLTRLFETWAGEVPRIIRLHETRAGPEPVGAVQVAPHRTHNNGTEWDIYHSGPPGL